jgi:hypothetical protein
MKKLMLSIVCLSLMCLTTICQAEEINVENKCDQLKTTAIILMVLIKADDSNRAAISHIATLPKKHTKVAIKILDLAHLKALNEHDKSLSNITEEFSHEIYDKCINGYI